MEDLIVVTRGEVIFCSAKYYNAIVIKKINFDPFFLYCLHGRGQELG